MKSLKNGTHTSTNSVTNISSVGFWILADEKEYFVAFNDYPGFKKASVEAIFNVKFVSPKQLHWQEIDIDIELDALEHPEIFTLSYQ